MFSIVKAIPSVNNLNAFKNLALNIRQQSVMTQQLVYSEYGDPVKVLKKKEAEMNENIEPHEVLIKMLAAPINPADINTIEGKYPVKPSLPAIAGNEGVAEILDVGSKVKNLCCGDHVVPLDSGLGTWRTHAVLPENLVFKVPKKLGLVEAATLNVNPCTAYRMLRDFVSLKPGDCVIQNGGNSSCGQYVIQICRVWGIKTVSVIRERTNLDEMKRFLCELGASHVITDKELRTTNLFKSGEAPFPKLALNCIGGQSALELLRHLAPSGTMVTYGGMSKEPVTIPTSALIFKDVKVLGFWMTRWTKNNFDSEERCEMLEELITMMINKEIRGPAFQMINFKDYQQALSSIVGGGGKVEKKYILDFE